MVLQHYLSIQKRVLKLIEKLLLIMTIVDPERFTPKGKPITFIGAFVELYN